LTKSAAPTLKDLRVFGLGLGMLCGVFCLLSWRKGGAAAPYWFWAGAAAALLGWLRPAALTPVYGPWMRVVGVIGAVNAFLLMAVVFYLMVTPYRLIARLLGKDLLDEKLGTGDSYWKTREPITDPKSYERQF